MNPTLILLILALIMVALSFVYPALDKVGLILVIIVLMLGRDLH